MAATGLDAIKMAQSYRRVLVEHLGMTTCRDLVLAERHVISDAMQAARLARKPSLEQIAVWQDDARRQLNDRATSAASDELWNQAASFIVCFQERDLGDRGWERRVEILQAEVEPEPQPASQPGWECGWLCGWMRAVVGLDASASVSSGERHAAAVPAAVAATVATNTRTKAPTAPPPLEFGAFVLVDVRGRHSVTLEGDRRAATLRCRLPAHLSVEVRRSAPDDPAQLTVRVRTSGRRDASTLPDIAVPVSGSTDIDLSQLPPGTHQLTIVAWTSAGSADPAVARLPALQIDPR
jgi:hypothetical protein